MVGRSLIDPTRTRYKELKRLTMHLKARFIWSTCVVSIGYSQLNFYSLDSIQPIQLSHWICQSSCEITAESLGIVHRV